MLYFSLFGYGHLPFNFFSSILLLEQTKATISWCEYIHAWMVLAAYMHAWLNPQMLQVVILRHGWSSYPTQKGPQKYRKSNRKGEYIIQAEGLSTHENEPSFMYSLCYYLFSKAPTDWTFKVKAFATECFLIVFSLCHVRAMEATCSTLVLVLLCTASILIKD